MPTNEEIIQKTEKEMESLESELQVCKESKPKSEACGNLCKYTEGVEEPFSSSYTEPICWHKNPSGGGGCIIL
jgi:hypothetical protein